jgi:hypothetical protein
MNTQELKQLQQELKALSDKVDKALNNEQQPTIQPFEGTKRVRITGVDNLRWYKNGQEYDVKYFSNVFYGLIDNYGCIYHEHCTEVEPQHQQAWEKYPNFESCWSHMDKQYNVLLDGRITEGRNTTDTRLYNFPTEALAKYSRAVMILSTVAKKWNEGVEKGTHIYFPSKELNLELFTDYWNTYSRHTDLLPFYFHSKEALQKCMELFPEEWKDFFNAKN